MKIFDKRGFSLIEVAVALVVVGLGLTALLRMFPYSLQESQKAKDDSSQTLFSSVVFSALRARASELTWDATGGNNWLNDSHLLNVGGFTLVAGTPSPPPPELKDLGVGSYLLLLRRNDANTIICATLWCTRFDVTATSNTNPGGASEDRRTSLLKQRTAYYSEFFYLGGKQ